MVPNGVLIIGGGVAGVSTIAALRAGGYDGDLTLIDAGVFPYDRPPLSKQYLAGQVELKDIALQSPTWFDEQSVRLITQSTVAAIRTGEGAVELEGGTVIAADAVVLATGGQAARPPIPGADDPHVHMLRTAEDADRLRSAVTPGSRLLIVGAGLIGAEVASTAAGLGCQVTLVDPIAAPLAGVVGSHVAAWLHGMHADHGVKAVIGTVESFSAAADDGIDAILTGQPPQTFDAVLLAVGMTADTVLAGTAGLAVERGVLVDDRNITSNPHVLAVGDVARACVNGVPGHRSEHWEAAQVDGHRAAAALLGQPAPVPSASWFWTDRYGRHVEAVGNLGHAERFVRRGECTTTPWATFGLTAGRVVGAVGVDDSTSVRAARRMIDRGLSIDPAALADPAADLRKMLKR